MLFEPIARALLFLHLVAAACVLGAAIHLAIRVWGYLRGKVAKVEQEKLYARILIWSYTICFALGAMIYPTFRVRVRADYFDTDLPWATGLFEAKEHLATLGFAAAIGVWLMSRAIGRSIIRPYLPLYAGLLAIVILTLLYNVWAGWYLTTLESV